MRYRLRTLLIVSAIGPPALALAVVEVAMPMYATLWRTQPIVKEVFVPMTSDLCDVIKPQP